MTEVRFEWAGRWRAQLQSGAEAITDDLQIISAGGALTCPSASPIRLMTQWALWLASAETDGIEEGGLSLSQGPSNTVVLSLGQDTLSLARLDLVAALLNAGLALYDGWTLHTAQTAPEALSALKEALDRLPGHRSEVEVTLDLIPRLAPVDSGPHGTLTLSLGDARPITTRPGLLIRPVEGLLMAVETALKTRHWPHGQYTFDLDEAGLRLSLTAAPEGLALTLLDRTRHPIAGPAHARPEDLARQLNRALKALDAPLHHKEAVATSARNADRIATWARTIAWPPAPTPGAAPVRLPPLPEPEPEPPQQTLPVAQLKHLAYRRRWRREVAGLEGRQVEVMGERILVPEAGGISAFDRATGDRLWATADLHPLKLPAPAGLFLGPDGGLVRLDPATGTILQRFDPIADPGALSDVFLSEALWLVGTWDGALVALDPAHGGVLWRRLALHGGIVSALAAGPMAWMVAEDGFLYGLDASTGALRFARPLEGELECSLVRSEGGLLVATWAGPGPETSLSLLNPVTGEPHWRLHLDGLVRARPTVQDGRAWLCLDRPEGASMAGIDLDAGTLIWTTHLPEGTDPGASPSLIGDLVLAKGLEGALAGLDAHTGALRWTLPDERDGEALVSNAPAVACRGLLLVPGTTIRAVAPEDGRVIHTLSCGELVPGWMHVWPEGHLLVAEDQALAFYLLGGHLALVPGGG